MADEEKLTIAVSRNFPKERLDDVIAVFSEYQKIEGPYERIQKSLESTLPKFIEFIGNYIIWAPFAIFGTSFLSRLGSRFADFTIEKIELALENEESKQFARIVRHLAEARRDL